MLFAPSPIGPIEIPAWEEAALVALSDDALLQRAQQEHDHFVISPAVFAMLEKRQLMYRLHRITHPHQKPDFPL